MGHFTVTLPGGALWEPKFVTALNQEKCIGCGRCVRVCARDVLQLVGISEEGDTIPLDPDDEDEDAEYEKKVMSIAHRENCVGCEACSRICPKKCYTHAPAALAGA